MRVKVLGILCLLSVVAPVQAQRAAPSAAVTRFASAPSSVAPLRVDTTTARTRAARMDGVARAALGVLGSVGGTLGGVYLGTSLPHGDCNCDDPGLEEALLGAAVGSVIGASIVAAVPRLSSRCSGEGRFGLALVSAAGGALVGGLLGGATYSGGGVVVGWMSGAAVGAGLGATACGRR